MFLNRDGKRWVRLLPNGNSVDTLTVHFKEFLQRLKLHRTGIGFYALRHTFETIGGGSRDQIAVDSIMGHADNSISNVYREKIDDARLQVVAAYVRQWLFADDESDDSDEADDGDILKFA